ncbi:alpha-L-arabinofuranosidase 2-like [Neltuma alba]|uniref:alpha-L-arabinofuranosidase 2-like n=1 Tax=Neltuma alba TaxID=207710 RepID=UPI0010A41FBE|nr:alpha-L-arabinofuranosidase 2-like [Prosopis alba]XP_028796502.1 alpha-L-arabinofuranosidase 2-like [Prosopis alba]
MASSKVTFCALLFIAFSLSLVFQTLADSNVISTLVVDAGSVGKQISKYFFGAFFEEINHVGAGGLWAELVNKRGFEAGRTTILSSISPWTVIGNRSTINVQNEPTSLFSSNKMAVKLDIHCSSQAECPNGVGLSNPGFLGQNIEQGKRYRVVFYLRSLGPINLKVAFIGVDGKELTSNNIKALASYVASWKRFETILEAHASDVKASLQLTMDQKGVIWLDQVSALPLDTYKGHGLGKGLFQKVADLKPTFLRFPSGCYVEGEYMRNAFRRKNTIGPWEKRIGPFNVWDYWVDNGFGYLEFLQLFEDLGTTPIWVFNNGISHHDKVNISDIGPMVQEALDGIEFARGPITSRWGKVRASLGHSKPFDLRYVGIGNEDCDKINYQESYLKFHDAIKHAYPDMQIISNCDATKKALDHPAELYGFHIYSNAKQFFSLYTKFDHMPCFGPKAFVSEYAVWNEDAGKGTLLSALGESAFLMGLERNSEVIEMVSYAPLFGNTNNQRWLPDAIVFYSHQSYGTPSYYLQKLFSDSSGAMHLNSTLKAPSSVVASVIAYTSLTEKKNYIKVKVVNFNDNRANFKITLNGLDVTAKSAKHYYNRDFLLVF